MIRYVFIFILLILFDAAIASIVNSLNYSQNTITIKDGLPNNKVNAIGKGSDGFMWFATNDGVCKYDGIHVKKYSLASLNTKGLNINHVNTLSVDPAGDMWVGGFSLFKYSKELDSLVHYSNSDTALQLGRVRAIQAGQNGELWIGSVFGLFTYYPYSDSLVYRKYLDVDRLEVLALLRYKDKVYIGTKNQGTLIYDIENGEYTALTIIDTPGGKPIRALSFLREQNNALWIGTNADGVIKIDFNNNSVKKFMPDTLNNIGNRVRDIVKDKSGNFLFGARAGLFFMPRGSENLNHYGATEEFSYTQSIFDIYIDNQDIVWIGTYARGIIELKPRTKSFYNYSKNASDPYGLNDDLINGFCEDSKGNIYIGTDKGGLNYLNRKTNKFTHYKHSENDPYSIKSDIVKQIISDDNGNLWLALYNGGIGYFNVSEQRFYNYNAAKGDNVYSLCFDQNNNLLVATDNGLELFDTDNKEAVQLKNIKNVLCFAKHKNLGIIVGTDTEGMFLYNSFTKSIQPFFTEFVDFTVRALHVDTKDNLWIGGGNGLIYLNISTGKYHHYTSQDGLPTNLIVGILEDDRKNIWVSSSAGLIKIKDAVNKPNDFDFKIFTNKDGIQNTHFLAYSFYKSSKGEMIFGGVNGFSIFYPDAIKINAYEPKLALTSIFIDNKRIKSGEKVYNKVVFSKDINKSRNIEVSYKHKILTIEFTALHFQNPPYNKYAYMLQPIESDWTYAEASHNSATYVGLPFGQYKFLLKGANADGLWTSEPLELLITVKPPFWSRSWFIVLMILILISIIVFLNQRQLRNLKYQKIRLEGQVFDRTEELTRANELLKNQTQELIESNDQLTSQKHMVFEQARKLKQNNEELNSQKEKLNELNKLKDKLFTIVAHDLRSPFHGVKGVLNLLSSSFHQLSNDEKYKYIQMATTAANKVSDLLEGLLNWARLQIDDSKIHPEFFNITEIIESNLELFKQRFESKGLKVSKKISDYVTVHADKNMIDGALRNLFSNAIKFSESNGEITVGIDSKSGEIVTWVADNGIGMNEETKSKLFTIDNLESRKGTHSETGSGLGLKIVKEYIEKNNGKIWVESEVNKGTTFYFSLPEE